MALVAQVPTSPAIAAAVVDVAAGLASGFRAKINTAKNSLDAKEMLVQACLEALTAQIGNGAVSGGAVTAGAALSVNVAILSAIVGSIVAFDAAQVVGGFAASVTNYLFLRQDGTWTIPPSGSATPPTSADGHGAALLWASVTTNTTSVVAVVNLARTFEQGRSHVLITAADPVSVAGDVWYNTTGSQMCVSLGGGIVKRSGAYT